MRGLKCIVDGQGVDPDSVGLPAMNYGQSHRWSEFVAVAIEYILPTAHFVAHMNPWFDQLRTELAADYRFEVPEPATAEAVFAGLGNPSLEAFIVTDPAAASVFLSDWQLEIYTALQGSSIRYVLDHMQSLTFAAGSVRIAGRGFDIEKKV